MSDCLKCAFSGPKYWSRGDDEEMLPFCFKRRIYEPSVKDCEDFKMIDDGKQS